MLLILLCFFVLIHRHHDSGAPLQTNGFENENRWINFDIFSNFLASPKPLEFFSHSCGRIGLCKRNSCILLTFPHCSYELLFLDVEH